ncbi:MAG: C_GCAxxG_C_C family protein [Deltaproteobacteria bacterium]|nr:C_GCAxxG_C_C family protein [Syntrophaceae bacterium]NLX52976.1 C_GCAxxG_C_C family protein [Deltaproteobacteria bacterium]
MAAVGREKLGRGHDDVIRAMGAFGGGLGGYGEVCGALAGALAVIGLRYSRAAAEEKENPKMWSDAQEMVRRFRDEIVGQGGTIACRDIARVDWTNRDEVRAFYRGERVQKCIGIVGATADVLGELLERDFFTIL